MSTLRIGVVGIGGMGGSHAMQIAGGNVPGTELTAVCDVNPDRLTWAREALSEKARPFQTDEALVASGLVDAVIIATPHYDHPPIAMRALERGLHVLTEKPAGVYTRQVRQMNEAAARSGRVFAIMFQQRTCPEHRKMKDLVDSGELGPVTRTAWIVTAWFRSQSYYDSGGWRATWAGEGGGVLVNQCPHSIDLWQWIAGMPRRVRAWCRFGKHHDIEVEDDVTAFVEYESGATGVFVTTTGESPGTNRFEIAGDRGKLVLEDGRLTFHRTRVPVAQFNRAFTGGFGEPECWKCDVPVHGPAEGHLGIMKDWVRAIRTGSTLLAPGVEGIRSLEISNAMLLSTWIDDWVQIPVDEDLFYAKLQERIASSARRKKSDGDRTMDVAKSF